MIPRLKPWIGSRELEAAMRPERNAVAAFEREFATTFDAPHAVAFPYGRSAIWALLKGLDLQNAEVIIPAYTCVVVAHAVALSGNVPRFVDVSAADGNIDLTLLEEAITPRTRMIVPTHLFGAPFDVDRLQRIVAAAETRLGHKIWVLQDCAHAFGARWHGELVCTRGDAALFGLNVSKTITSIFGGMITTADASIAGVLRKARERHFTPPGAGHSAARVLYLHAAVAGFSSALYGVTAWLQHSTPVLDRLTRAYHLDDLCRFPPDAFSCMTDVEAAVGRVQLQRYADIVHHRRGLAARYHAALLGTPGLELPVLAPGSTWSHYAVRVLDRAIMCDAARKLGVELGTLIDYSVPERPEYRATAAGAWPVAHRLSETTINLPIHKGVTDAVRHRVVEAVRAGAERCVREGRRAA